VAILVILILRGGGQHTKTEIFFHADSYVKSVSDLPETKALIGKYL